MSSLPSYDVPAAVEEWERIILAEEVAAALAGPRAPRPNPGALGDRPRRAVPEGPASPSRSRSRPDSSFSPDGAARTRSDAHSYDPSTLTSRSLLLSTSLCDRDEFEEEGGEEEEDSKREPDASVSPPACTVPVDGIQPALAAAALSQKGNRSGQAPKSSFSVPTTTTSILDESDDTPSAFDTADSGTKQTPSRQHAFSMMTCSRERRRAIIMPTCEASTEAVQEEGEEDEEHVESRVAPSSSPSASHMYVSGSPSTSRGFGLLSPSELDHAELTRKRKVHQTRRARRHDAFVLDLFGDGLVQGGSRREDAAAESGSISNEGAAASPIPVISVQSYVPSSSSDPIPLSSASSSSASSKSSSPGSRSHLRVSDNSNSPGSMTSSASNSASSSSSGSHSGMSNKLPSITEDGGIHAHTHSHSPHQPSSHHAHNSASSSSTASASAAGCCEEVLLEAQSSSSSSSVIGEGAVVVVATEGDPENDSFDFASIGTRSRATTSLLGLPRSAEPSSTRTTITRPAGRSSLSSSASSASSLCGTPDTEPDDPHTAAKVADAEKQLKPATPPTATTSTSSHHAPRSSSNLVSGYEGFEDLTWIYRPSSSGEDLAAMFPVRRILRLHPRTLSCLNHAPPPTSTPADSAKSNSANNKNENVATSNTAQAHPIVPSPSMSSPSNPIIPPERQQFMLRSLVSLLHESHVPFAHMVSDLRQENEALEKLLVAIHVAKESGSKVVDIRQSNQSALTSNTNRLDETQTALQHHLAQVLGFAERNMSLHHQVNRAKIYLDEMKMKRHVHGHGIGTGHATGTGVGHSGGPSMYRSKHMMPKMYTQPPSTAASGPSTPAAGTVDHASSPAPPSQLGHPPTPLSVDATAVATGQVTTPHTPQHATPKAVHRTPPLSGSKSTSSFNDFLSASHHADLLTPSSSSPDSDVTSQTISESTGAGVVVGGAGDLSSTSSSSSTPDALPSIHVQRFHVTKINRIRKNTPRIFELDLNACIITICKRSTSSGKDSGSSSAGTDDDFGSRNVVLGPSSIVSLELHPKNPLQLDMVFTIGSGSGSGAGAGDGSGSNSAESSQHGSPSLSSTPSTSVRPSRSASSASASINMSSPGINPLSPPLPFHPTSASTMPTSPPPISIAAARRDSGWKERDMNAPVAVARHRRMTAGSSSSSSGSGSGTISSPQSVTKHWKVLFSTAPERERFYKLIHLTMMNIPAVHASASGSGGGSGEYPGLVSSASFPSAPTPPLSNRKGPSSRAASTGSDSPLFASVRSLFSKNSSTSSSSSPTPTAAAAAAQNSTSSSSQTSTSMSSFAPLFTLYQAAAPTTVSNTRSTFQLYTPRSPSFPAPLIQQVRSTMPIHALASSLHEMWCIHKQEQGWKYDQASSSSSHSFVDDGASSIGHRGSIQVASPTNTRSNSNASTITNLASGSRTASVVGPPTSPSNVSGSGRDRAPTSPPLVSSTLFSRSHAHHPFLVPFSSLVLERRDYWLKVVTQTLCGVFSAGFVVRKDYSQGIEDTVMEMGMGMDHNGEGRAYLGSMSREMAISQSLSQSGEPSTPTSARSPSMHHRSNLSFDFSSSSMTPSCSTSALTSASTSTSSCLPHGLLSSIDHLASSNHDLWSMDKLRNGWKWDSVHTIPGSDIHQPSNSNAKTHPGLIPWDYLSQERKEKQRRMVGAIFSNLLEWGYVFVQAPNNPNSQLQHPSASVGTTCTSPVGNGAFSTPSSVPTLSSPPFSSTQPNKGSLRRRQSHRFPTGLSGTGDASSSAAAAAASSECHGAISGETFMPPPPM